MSKVKTYVGNPLGDLRAEADHNMLDKAFYETPEYLTLIESADKSVIVGRRGSGKSALAYRLTKHWGGTPKTRVIPISLYEDQVIALKAIIELFGEKYNHIRAGCSLAWHYCLAMEIALELANYYKFEKAEGSPLLREHLGRWRKAGKSASSRLKNTLKEVLSSGTSPEERIGDLVRALGLDDVECALGSVSKELGFNCILLIDKLDEGYEPTDKGVGFVDGIIDATITINKKYSGVRATLFLRDNMFRTIARCNPDFSRNIEGQVLRLHWTEYHLWTMICNRLRVAFAIDQEATVKIWNRCACRELAGKDGFKKCLKFTLYRPRDILVLLNEAFYEASKEDREQIILQDVRIAAKSISQHRLEDLHREYSAIFPGLEHLTTAFANGKPEFNLASASTFLEERLSSKTYTSDVEQQFAILKTPLDAIRALYGIGFVGIHDNMLNAHVFCHDGKSPDREISQDDNFLVHPCYWMALNLTRDGLDPGDVQDIHDEYDITVKGGCAELREKKLNGLISQLGQIPLGSEGQKDFEEWCFGAIQTVLASGLPNIELRQIEEAKERRCVVGLNLSRTEVWKRVYEDYQARQVVFVIENMEGLNREHYQAAIKGLSEANGSIVFLVTRDRSSEMHKESDLAWVRDIFEKDEIVVIKVSAKVLSNLLGKIRNPQKHNAVEEQFNTILDTYSRNYLGNLKRKTSTKKVEDGLPSTKPETVQISAPSSDCYGEIDLEKDGQPVLMLFGLKGEQGKHDPGRRAQVCAPIKLGDQAYRILEAGIKNARNAYIAEKREGKVRDDTQNDQYIYKYIYKHDFEPPAEKTYYLSWSQDELAGIIHDENQFSQLQRRQKRAIKTAMSRVRNLVRFSDGKGMLTDPDPTGSRQTTIQFRFRKSG